VTAPDAHPAPLEPQASGPADPHDEADARARTLTTRTVAALLVGFGVATALGMALSQRAGQAVGPEVSAGPLQELARGLPAFDAAAWLSLGVVFLFGTTVARVLGMALSFKARDDRRALAAALLITALLGVSMARGLLREQPRPPAPELDAR
jgi:uncharacterized membrane protein